jgi:5'-3' exonuclease
MENKDSHGPVVLVDFMNLVFRMHWSLPNLMHEGKHTGVQYGVIKTIHQLRTNVSTRMIFVWDHGVPIPGAQRPRNWREDLLPAYKGNRKRDPNLYDIVFSQLKDLHDAIKHLGYSQVSVMGLEADDMIGLLSQAYPEVRIFSTDKDFYQLLDEARVHVLVPKKDKGEFKKIYKSDVEREYGIPVSRFAEYLALGGDSCDNIKAKRGMGPKTAIKLILSGVDLTRPLEGQPKEFREKYGPVWKAIKNSYYASRIPLNGTDPRINSCIRNSCITIGWPPSPDQGYGNVKAFDQFLAERNMVSLLAIRRSFFERSPVQQCQSASKPVQAKLSNRTLI